MMAGFTKIININIPYSGIKVQNLCSTVLEYLYDVSNLLEIYSDNTVEICSENTVVLSHVLFCHVKYCLN